MSIGQARAGQDSAGLGWAGLGSVCWQRTTTDRSAPFLSSIRYICMSIMHAEVESKFHVARAQALTNAHSQSQDEGSKKSASGENPKAEAEAETRGSWLEPRRGEPAEAGQRGRW